jgi:hypothetical protein
VRRDTVALEQVLAPEFVLSGSAPARETRAQYLATAAMPDRVLEPIELEDRDVRIYGATAVTTGRAMVRGSRGGRSFALVVRYTNVFVRADHRWRAVAGQITAQD